MAKHELIVIEKELKISTSHSPRPEVIIRHGEPVPRFTAHLNVQAVEAIFPTSALPKRGE
jgi:hypothetical protein